MNYDEFAATCLDPAAFPRYVQQTAVAGTGEVTLAGSVLYANAQTCCLDVNGTRYEVDPKDVIDIQVLAGAAKPKPDEQATEGGDEQATEGGEAPKGPQVVLVKVRGNAVLWRSAPVPAALIAVLGTWMHIVPVPQDAA